VPSLSNEIDNEIKKDATLTNTSTLQNHVERIIAKAWADDSFRARLLTDPAAVAAAEGIPVPAGLKIVVHESKPGELLVVLPAKPTSELSDAELEGVAGGGESVALSGAYLFPPNAD
jgi:hypothetical protein